MALEKPRLPDERILAMAAAVSGIALPTLLESLAHALDLAEQEGIDPWSHVLVPDPPGDPFVAAVRAYILQIAAYARCRAKEIAEDERRRLGAAIDAAERERRRAALRRRLAELEILAIKAEAGDAASIRRIDDEIRQLADQIAHAPKP